MLAHNRARFKLAIAFTVLTSLLVIYYYDLGHLLKVIEPQSILCAGDCSKFCDDHCKETCGPTGDITKDPLYIKYIQMIEDKEARDNVLILWTITSVTLMFIKMFIDKFWKQ